MQQGGEPGLPVAFCRLSFAIKRCERHSPASMCGTCALERHFPWSTAFPPPPLPPQELPPQPCSAASLVLRGSPTSRFRGSSSYARLGASIQSVAVGQRELHRVCNSFLKESMGEMDQVPVLQAFAGSSAARHRQRLDHRAPRAANPTRVNRQVPNAARIFCAPAHRHLRRTGLTCEIIATFPSL